MAKKKHHKKRHHRSVGALNPRSPLVMLGSLAVGYFLAADSLNAAIDKFNITPAPGAGGPATTKIPGTIVLTGEAGVGALLLLSKKKTGTMGLVKTVAGGILAGAGLKRALKTFGIISGYQSVPVIGRRMAGYQAVPVIGATRPAQLAGSPAQLQGGFRVNGPNNGYIPTGSGAKVMGGFDSGNPMGCL